MSTTKGNLQRINRQTSIIVGALFIVGTVSGVLSALITGPIFDDPNYLEMIFENQTQVIVGAICVLSMGFSLAMVPVMMYPIFKKHNGVLALGSVVFRGVLEAVAYMAMVISWFLLIVLSQEHVNAGASESAFFQIIGTLLLAADDLVNPILQIVFSIGAMMFYYLFYATELIPRWLSGWGLIGAIIYFVWGLIALFGLNLEFLAIPLALQEMVLAVWLIVKGFNRAAIDSGSVV
jgi:hypothetical protein